MTGENVVSTSSTTASTSANIESTGLTTASASSTTASTSANIESSSSTTACGGNAHFENQYFLGCNYGAAYWFYYEKDRATTLDIQFLQTIKNKYEQYIIYADICLLQKELLRKNNIIFKRYQETSSFFIWRSKWNLKHIRHGL
ncbi:MAG: hypothetical protein II098_06015 [Treponema sp.]|nr:hypothetical protein [Treponema sp.]